MDVASSEFHTDDGMYDLDFKVCACVKLCKHSRRRDQLLGGEHAYFLFIHLSAGAFVDVRLCSIESAATSDFLPRLLDIFIFSWSSFRLGSRNK